MGGHVFPKRRWKDQEFADRGAFTDMAGPLMGKISGHLGEQDISSTEAGGGKLFGTSSIATDAYYAAYQVKAAVSMALTTGGNRYAKPNTGGSPAGATVLDSQEWQVVKDAASSSRLEKTISAGEDILCVFAAGQLAGWLGDLGSVTDAVSDESYRTQVAVRLDGSVIETTITGPSYYPDPPPRQIYKASAVSSSSDFDYRHIFWQQNGTGLPNHLQPFRVTTTFPVAEGSRTVDLAARRVPRANGQVDNSKVGSSVQMFNRRLFVLRLKGSSAFSGGSTLSATVAAWAEGEAVSQASLMTNRLKVLRDNLNDVGEAQVERAALRNEHLPSCVLYPSVRTLTPGSSVPIPATSTYAGYGATSGWQVVSNGAGTDLYVDAGGGGFVLTGNDGVLVVLANVEVKELGVTASNESRAVGLFLIRYRDSTGTWNYLGETEVALTPRNQTEVEQADGSDYFGSAGYNPSYEDVPLLWVVDTAALLVTNPNASTIQRIEVVQATHDGTGTGLTVNMRTQRACLTAFLLKGVSLG